MPVRAGLSLILGLSVMTVISGCANERNPTHDTGRGPFEVRAEDFSPSAACGTCHSQHYEEWSGSMHAYAMADPVWIAARNAGQSAYANALAGACTPCHATIAHRAGLVSWGPIDFDNLPPQATEGVGCDVCHTISTLHGASNASFALAPGRIKQGTIADPQRTSAHESVYNPLYADGAYCGSCHDLKLDNGLELEMLYQEWEQEGFAATGKTCNDCHMPEYAGSAAPGAPVRTLHRHYMPGVDIALIDFPHRETQFQLVTDLLRSAVTMEAELALSPEPDGGADLVVALTNDGTGHNVPSGVPFNREMWLEVIVRDASGTVLYTSGGLDENGDLMDSSRDPDLFNAQATMLKADSTPTFNTWEALYLINPSIRPGETRRVEYHIDTRDAFPGPLTSNIRLRFRSFPPPLLRALGLHELLPVPIIDMAEAAVIGPIVP